MAIVNSINIKNDGGVPKFPVSNAYLGKNNVEGDKQNDLEYHGGPTRAVCLFSLERILALQKEGHPIQPGTTGENLTIEGLDWRLMKIGANLPLLLRTKDFDAHRFDQSALRISKIEAGEADFENLSECG